MRCFTSFPPSSCDQRPRVLGKKASTVFPCSLERAAITRLPPLTPLLGAWDRVAVARPLGDGIYEHLVTDDVATALESIESQVSTGLLDNADAHVALSAHVGSEIRRALASLPQEDRAERARELVGKIFEYVATLVGAEAAESIREQQVAAPARQLLAIHRGSPPERPSTPLSTSTLLTRGPTEPTLGHELSREIATADRIDAIVAFVTVGGVRAIRESLERFSLREGTELRLLTTTFTGTTEVAALDSLAKLPRARVKVSYDTRRTRLHAKAWLFYRNSGVTTAYIGSANLTSTALGSGHEWMVKVCAGDLPHVIDRFIGTFDTLWEDPEFEPYSGDSEAQRSRLRVALAGQGAGALEEVAFLVALRPLPYQAEILDKLEAERLVHGRRRNLLVAATGTGKTVIAALDYARQSAKAGVQPRLLYLAHRKELLEQARRTFRYALQDAAFGELLVGGEEPRRFDHVFASIQSVSSAGLIDRLGAGHFRHVVVDECHHVPAASYQAVVPRLQPDLLLGLTATPERTDGRSLLPDFDGHIAAELRLWHALDDQLLVPFEYYGISDGVDLRAVRWSRGGYDSGHLGDIYTGHDARAKLVAQQLAKRVGDVRGLRALGFCVSVGHADFMAVRFTELGIPALSIHGSSPAELREEAPRLLRDRKINVLFTCDLYNEGVDLPFVDTLLLLRPTQSATLFLQQLGRGLRHSPGKDSCLVLDFIGQHRDEFRFDVPLAAITGLSRGRLKEAVQDDFPLLPSGCSMNLDAVAREQVLRCLKAATGGAQKLLAELRALASAGAAPTLAQFLEETGRDVVDVYEAGGWTTLRRRAGLVDADAADDDLSRRLIHLLHIDEPDRLRTYRDALAAALDNREAALTDRDRVRFHMLEFLLEHRGKLRPAEETIRHLAARPEIVRELDELREVLLDRVAIPHQRYPMEEWPLALHRHYQRREIVAGVRYVGAGDTKVSLQSGILSLPNQRQVLFVTLDKSGKGFSPTTRYRDYAISPELFHWETQSAASVARPTGRRYLESAVNGWSFFLFVRTNPSSAFAFLGPVAYQSHAGDRPIGITWRLATPMPAALFERYATMRAG